MLPPCEEAQKAPTVRSTVNMATNTKYITIGNIYKLFTQALNMVCRGFISCLDCIGGLQIPSWAHI